MNDTETCYKEFLNSQAEGTSEFNLLFLSILLLDRIENEIFFVNFDFEKGCKNEFEDNIEKSCSRFKNRVPA